MPLSYRPDELGALQQEILRHMFVCSERSENVSHISKSLGKLQPSVQRSVDYLSEKDYLRKGEKYSRGRKELILTQKGVAAAMVYGAKIEELDPYYKKHDQSFYEQLQQFRRLFNNSEKSNLYSKKTAQFLLEHNLFDKGNMKNSNSLTEDEQLRMDLYQLNAAIEYFHSINFGKGAKNISEFIDRLKINKDVMKEYLLRRKNDYEWALREIDKKGTGADPSRVA